MPVSIQVGDIVLSDPEKPDMPVCSMCRRPKEELIEADFGNGSLVGLFCRNDYFKVLRMKASVRDLLRDQHSHRPILHPVVAQRPAHPEVGRHPLTLAARSRAPRRRRRAPPRGRR